MIHKVQRDNRAQLQPSLQDSPWETAPLTPAPARRDWAILNRPAGARRNESRTMDHESRFDKLDSAVLVAGTAGKPRTTDDEPRITNHEPRRVIAPSGETHRSPGKSLTRSNSRARIVRAGKSGGGRRAPETQNNEKPYWPNEPTLAASTTASTACGRMEHRMKGDLQTPDVGKRTEARTTSP